MQSLLADTVRLEYAENTGGFLGLGADLPAGLRRAIFTGGTGLLLLAAIVAIFRLRWTRLSVIGLSLAFAGGAANWLDRVVDGRVVDFMSVGVGGLRSGIFNVADVAVMLGLCIVVFTSRERDLYSSEDIQMR